MPRKGNSNGHVVSADAEHGKMSVAAKSNKRRARGSGGTKGSPDAVKKLLWAGVVSGSMAVGTIAARRASAEIWRGIFHEDPPTKDV